MEEQKEPVTGDTISRLFLGCLLFRLGGEQVFTTDEIAEIKETVGGVQILLTQDNKFLVRTRSPQVTDEAVRNGSII